MSHPKSKDEWWAVLESQWDNITSILGDQIDLKHPAYERPGKPESELTGAYNSPRTAMAKKSQ